MANDEIRATVEQPYGKWRVVLAGKAVWRGTSQPAALQIAAHINRALWLVELRTVEAEHVLSMRVLPIEDEEELAALEADLAPPNPTPDTPT